jgi:hypothetical protein
MISVSRHLHVLLDSIDMRTHPWVTTMHLNNPSCLNSR